MADEVDVYAEKKPGVNLWYVKINGRITGAASNRAAAKDMAAKLADRISQQPDLEIPKARLTKTKTGAISKAAQKRIAKKKASE